jgi:tRNA uridine 5-carboxymethylaminomethyl modification enzyme
MEVGAVAAERCKAFAARQAEKLALEEELSATASADRLIHHGLEVKRDAGKMPLYDWLRYPIVSVRHLLAVSRETDVGLIADNALIAEIEQDGRYAPYLERQEAEIRDLAANERINLPTSLNYRSVAGLSNEMVERLDAARPDNLAAAARVRGVTPAALAAILVHAKRAAPDSVAA